MAEAPRLPSPAARHLLLPISMLSACMACSLVLQEGHLPSPLLSILTDVQQSPRLLAACFAGGTGTSTDGCLLQLAAQAAATAGPGPEVILLTATAAAAHCHRSCRSVPAQPSACACDSTIWSRIPHAPCRRHTCWS